MFMRHLIRLAGFVLLSLATPAYADDAPDSGASPTNANTANFNQILYKGLVGTALEAVPMDPAQRVSLQRTNAVVSNTWSGRSLAALAKLTHPALSIGGFVWGLWAASNIHPPAATVSVPSSDTADARKETDANADEFISGDTLLTVNSSAAPRDFKPAPVNAHTPAESVAPMTTRTRVIKIWIAQPAH